MASLPICYYNSILPASSTLISRPPFSIVEFTIKNPSDTLKPTTKFVISLLNPFTTKHVMKSHQKNHVQIRCMD